MKNITFSTSATISFGHKVLQGQEEQEHECQNLHGHDFHFTIDFVSDDKVVFANRYEAITRYLKDNWENRMLVYDRDPMGMKLSEIDPNVVFVPFNPTADGIAEYIVVVLGTSLLRDTNYTITKCSVQQGNKLTANYTIL